MDKAGTSFGLVPQSSWKGCAKALLFIALLLQPGAIFAESISPDPELADPRLLLPADAEIPTFLEHQAGRDVDIRGSTWADSVRSYRRVDAAPAVDVTSLTVRVSVYPSSSEAEDWLHFFSWSQAKTGFTGSQLFGVGEDGYVLRRSGPTAIGQAQEDVGILFRVGAMVGWAHYRDDVGKPCFENALEVAHLIEARMGRAYSF